jgi:hypothetical protein
MINLTDLFGAEAPQIDPVVQAVAEPDLPDDDDRDYPDTAFPGAVDPRSWGPPPLVRLTGLCSPIPDDQRLQIGDIHPAADPRPLTVCDRCGSTDLHDCVTADYTVRVECRRCGRFCGWRKWRNLDLGAFAQSHDDQRDQARQERLARIMGQTSGKVKPASELTFDYSTATAVANRGNR